MMRLKTHRTARKIQFINICEFGTFLESCCFLTVLRTYGIHWAMTHANELGWNRCLRCLVSLRDAKYVFCPDNYSIVTLNTCGSQIDTVLYVMGPYINVTSDDDGNCGAASYLRVPGTPSTRKQCRECKNARR
eukprot:2262602-Amphidinium_carterae.1